MSDLFSLPQTPAKPASPLRDLHTDPPPCDCHGAVDCEHDRAAVFEQMSQQIHDARRARAEALEKLEIVCEACGEVFPAGERHICEAAENIETAFAHAVIGLLDGIELLAKLYEAPDRDDEQFAANLRKLRDYARRVRGTTQ